MMDLSKYNQSWFNRGRNNIIVVLWFIVNKTIFNFSLHNMYGYRAFLLKLFGCKIGKNVKVRRKVDITYPWKVEIGDNTWIDEEVILYSLDNIKIGSNCSITRRSFLCTGSHDLSDPYFGLIVKPINILDGVWIQADCFIGQGVTIGKNSVIGARSSVFRNMPDNMICIGTPSKPVKERIFKNE